MRQLFDLDLNLDQRLFLILFGKIVQMVGNIRCRIFRKYCIIFHHFWLEKYFLYFQMNIYYEIRYSISSDFIETFNIDGFHIFVLLIKMIDQILVFEKNSGH